MRHLIFFIYILAEVNMFAEGSISGKTGSYQMTSVVFVQAIFFIAGVMTLLIIYLGFKLVKKNLLLKDAGEKLRFSEEKNRALLTANPDLLFIFDSEYNFLDYKAEVKSELIADPSDFIGKNVLDVLPPDLAELTIKQLNIVRNTGEMQSYGYEIEVDGEKLYFESRLVKSGENNFLAVVRNITEKKKRDEETGRSHKLESLGIFAGGIAHDFNNILSAIVGSISIARMKIDNKEKAIKHLEEAEKAGLRARRLTEQLLAFSKGGNPVKQISDISEVVMESADFIMSGSKTALSYNFGKDLLKADIDRGQISQVVQNIILNASQSMPAGGVITITLRNEYLKIENSLLLPEGWYIAIDIEDEGEGIEAKNIKKIFDPYFTTKNNGNGLGLTICHTIVKRHGGGIDIKSSPGKGSIFTVYIPASVSINTVSNYELKQSDKQLLKDKSIIIMDDEPQLRNIMEEVLSDEGANVFTVSDGGEAIDLFEKLSASEQFVDLIISDLTIPGGMGGMEAIRIIREQGIPFKAIVISGYSNDPVMSEFNNYGFDAYIAKPFTVEDLLFTVLNVLNNK